MKIKVKLDPNAIMPTRAHKLDAGYDIYAREIGIVPAHGSAVFDSGVHIAIPEGYVGFLMSKSGLNVKHDITGTGVIDAGYTGSIKVKLYNNSDFDFFVTYGDKLIQLVILPIITPELEFTDRLDDTDRGEKGFGSSGRNHSEEREMIKRGKILQSRELEENHEGKVCTKTDP